MTHENEYHDNMVALLELIWGKGYMAPGGPGNVAKSQVLCIHSLTSSRSNHCQTISNTASTMAPARYHFAW